MIQVFQQEVYRTLSSTDLENLTIYFKGLRDEYKQKSKVKFRLVGRELYPTRGFDTTPNIDC